MGCKKGVAHDPAKRRYRPGSRPPCACGGVACARGLCHVCLARERRQAAPARPCRHCKTRRANRPRQLCWDCYYHKPGVRERYEPIGARGRAGALGPHGDGDFFGGYALAAEATDTPVGSAARLAVLEKRAEARVALHHPRDSRERARPAAGVPAPGEGGGDAA